MPIRSLHAREPPKASLCFNIMQYLCISSLFCLFCSLHFHPCCCISYNIASYCHYVYIHITPLVFIYLTTRSLYLLTICLQLLLPPLSAFGKQESDLFLYEFAFLFLFFSIPHTGEITYSVCLSLSDLFHLTQCPQGLSMWLQVFPSSMWIANSKRVTTRVSLYLTVSLSELEN